MYHRVGQPCDVFAVVRQVGTLLVTSPWAVKEMCHPLFASQMQGKVRILSQYLSPARVAAEVGAGKGILLSAPIVQVGCGRTPRTLRESAYTQCLYQRCRTWMTGFAKVLHT